MKLAERLENEMPIRCVVATCGVCGEELYHSKKEKPNSAYMTGEIIEMVQKQHHHDTSHDDLVVSLDKPAPKKSVSYTIEK